MSINTTIPSFEEAVVFVSKGAVAGARKIDEGIAYATPKVKSAAAASVQKTGKGLGWLARKLDSASKQLSS